MFVRLLDTIQHLLQLQLKLHFVAYVLLYYFARLAGEKIAIGGCTKDIKKEKGLKFGRPSLSIVLTRQ